MIKINVKKIISIIILLVMFEPPYISELFPSVHLVCIALKIATLGFVLLSFFSKYAKQAKYEKILILYVSYCLYQLINTILQGQGVNGAISDFCFCMYFIYACTDKNTDLFDFLYDVHLVLTIYAVINMITMILYPNGMWNVPAIGEYWFLGMDNMFINYMYPLTVISVMLLRHHFRWVYLFTIGISVGTLLSRWAATSMIGIIIFLILVLLPKKISIKIKPKYFFVAMIIISIILMGSYSSNLLEYIVVDLLHKDLTFSNRSFIWEIALLYIIQKPLFGYGKLISSVFSGMLKLGSHPHNMCLYQLFVGGGLGALAYAILSFMAFERLNKEVPEDHAIILSAALSGIYIMGITESMAKIFLEIPLILAIVVKRYKWEQNNG